MAPKKGHFLKKLGISSDKESFLLTPVTYLDCTQTQTNFDLCGEGVQAVFVGRIRQEPSVVFAPKKAPRSTFMLEPLQGRNPIFFTIFGDTRELSEELLNSERVCIHGSIQLFASKKYLSDIVIIKEEDCGKVIPKYAVARTGLKSEQVYAYIKGLSPSVLEESIEHIKEKLKISSDNESRPFRAIQTPINDFRTLIDNTHYPKTVNEGTHTLGVWDCISAQFVAKSLHSDINTSNPDSSIVIDQATVSESIAKLPFELVSDQRSAVDNIIADLAKPLSMRHLLNGDVGSGKTAVFLSVALSVIKAGGRVSIMAPNGTLAEQIHREALEMEPALDSQLILGKTAKGTKIDSDLVIGTQALFHRIKKDNSFSLVVIDEQQRFSREQRESLVSSAGNLLEVTATCIPRTKALINLGGMNVSVIRQAHSKKTINSRLIVGDSSQMMEVVSRILAQNGRILVVYPLKESSAEGEKDITSVTEAFESWNNAYPNKVRMAHGKMSQEEKVEAIKDLSELRANILVATTVVEVGINIPDLQYCVVVNPDRSGLVTLHQIRGRLVRKGGEGWFDMFIPQKASEATLERLNVLVNSNDGFEIAQKDLDLRGAGDIRSKGNSQSGSSNGLLPQRKLNISFVEHYFSMLNRRQPAA